MAQKKENIKMLFTNTRSRVIIVFTAIIMLVAIVIGLTKFFSGNKSAADSSLANAPAGIRSIPGALDPTAEYAKLQEAQNVSQATSALKTGQSAIPTIIRSQSVGSGVNILQPKTGQTGVGFSALTRETQGGDIKTQWLQQLKDNNCSKTAVAQVLEQGATLSDVKKVCSCIQLKDDGYSLRLLKTVCACKELKASGVSVRQLKDNGYSAGELRQCGFNACEVKNAGFTADQMKEGGFSDGELKGAGFSDPEIAKAGGLPNGITAADVRRAGCDAQSLAKLRQAGVTAAAIRRISGCSAAQLKAAGYNAKELKAAGFTAAELKKAGFSPAQLKQAGFSARDLLNAGFSPKELADAGFTPAQIAQAQAQLPPGITPQDVKNAGCSKAALTNERLAGVSAREIKKYADCSAQALKDAGFSNKNLTQAGFSPEQITAIKPNDESIRAAGCDINQLKLLRQQGVSAQKIHQLNGCSAAQLKAAGFNAKDLLAAGFSPQTLQSIGFTPQELTQAGANPADLIAKGRQEDCSQASLAAARSAGVSALTIRKTLGCSASQMKAAGYTAAELRDAGFSAAELKNAGFSAAQLKAAGFSARQLRDAGFSASQLKAAGFSASQLRDAGFSAKALKDAGFSAMELKNAGFSAKDLKNAGFSAEALKQAGFSAKSLQNAGFSTKDLKNAGFTDGQLQAAGIKLNPEGYTDASKSMANMNPSAIPNPFQNKDRTLASANAQKLNNILDKQNQQMVDQKYQQKVQQYTAKMQSAASQMLSDWKKVSAQMYIVGPVDKTKSYANGSNPSTVRNDAANGSTSMIKSSGKALIKTGDILFAVIDTSVNSDEPGPILATIVTGKYKNAKLIGSFTLPTNADKMIISFNTISVPGANKTASINAVAIDANTARTALASTADHHYLLRYGSLFASSFLEGFGNAFQSADTTVTIGGTGGGDNITVQNGIGRSALENAVIGLATVGKAWGQVAQQQFNTPTTVEVYSGTGIGVLFTQDVQSLQ
ncbi:MAG: type IV secretion protein IcmE [Legionellaceae bacterium]|nr:type IV secretion protein IcmE [Legionellaceae bacterium]HAF87632.1 type IV secretion protein IcmE [Legionellales bacterium]HCA89313.1 type IV secretion protein IcmE [Legionellales bacterium]|tara:strand:- start:257 stop:3262 length:3006 start_codon:yes stop_codon:yes gene_type:complete